MMTNEDYYELLSDGQTSNVFKYQRRKTGQYYALAAENDHLPKYMLTLSTKDNTMQSTLLLRQKIIKLLNGKKYLKSNKGKTLAYFSAIELGLNKNPPSKDASMTEERRMKLSAKNYHLHIQLWTDIDMEDIKSALEKVPKKLSIHKKLSISKLKDAKYDYVIKDIKKIDWRLQYILKTQHKGVQLHTSSRKKMANYMITRLWGFMKVHFQYKWNEIKDKYEFVMDAKNRGDIVFNKDSTQKDGYYILEIPNNSSYIHIKRDIFANKEEVTELMSDDDIMDIVGIKYSTTAVIEVKDKVVENIQEKVKVEMSESLPYKMNILTRRKIKNKKIELRGSSP